MPIAENNLSSFINNSDSPIDSTNNDNDMDSTRRNTKTHSSVFCNAEYEQKKMDMNDIPLPFASFYYSLKVSKGKGMKPLVK